MLTTNYYQPAKQDLTLKYNIIIYPRFDKCIITIHVELTKLIVDELRDFDTCEQDEHHSSQLRVQFARRIITAVLLLLL